MRMEWGRVPDCTAPDRAGPEGGPHALMEWQAGGVEPPLTVTPPGVPGSTGTCSAGYGIRLVPARESGVTFCGKAMQVLGYVPSKLSRHPLLSYRTALTYS